MLSQYGVQSKINVAAGAVNSPVNGNSYDIALSPLFFVRGGYINSSSNETNKFIGAGREGYGWSSLATTSANAAYYLHVGNSSVLPSYSASRYYGRPLRCLISTP